MTKLPISAVGKEGLRFVELLLDCQVKGQFLVVVVVVVMVMGNDRICLYERRGGRYGNS